MSKAEDLAEKAYPEGDIYIFGDASIACRVAYVKGYRQAEKDVAEAFARIIHGNLSMINKSVQDKFEQLYTDITGEKMYKGFKD